MNVHKCPVPAVVIKYVAIEYKNIAEARVELNIFGGGCDAPVRF
jgi:hypothetical protein